MYNDYNTRVQHVIYTIMANNNIKKCIAFLRVSSAAQHIESQKQEVFNAIRRHGYNDNEVLCIEQTESAIKLAAEDRISLQQLYAAIEKHKTIEFVFVYEISRLTRQSKMMYEIRDFLISHRVNLYCLKPEFTLLDKDYKMSQTASILFSLFTSLSESEMMIKKERMRRGAEYKKKQGLHAGGSVAIGYGVDKEGRYIIDEEGARWVRRIFNDYVNGWSIRKLARQLQSEGWRTQTAFLTVCQSILNILHREYYCGDRAHPAIISRDMFEQAQIIAHNKTRYKTDKPNEALLKGIIYDAESGYIMSSNVVNGQYYSKRYGHCTINIKAAEMVVSGVAREWYAELYDTRKDEHIARLDEQITRLKNTINTMTNNITANQDKIDRIEERYIEGKINKEKADAMEKRMFSNIQMWRDTLKTSELEIERLNTMKSNVDERMIISDIRTIIHDVVTRVEVRRLTRFVCEMKIYNRYTGEIRIIEVNTRKCEIVNIKILKRPTLPAPE